MVKITKRLCMVLAMAVLVISFSIPFTLFPSKVYADTVPYVIGDTSPAGGIVFYDKGDDIGGWRYLEAAPIDQTTAMWSYITDFLGTTETGIGTGLANTEAIISQIGSTPNPTSLAVAAQECRDYRLGGYSDWFLPSRDELVELWAKLANTPQKRLDNGFDNDKDYWSSSEDENQYHSPVDYYSAYFVAAGTASSGPVKSTVSNVRAIRAFTGMKEIANASSKPLTPQEQVMLNLSTCQQADLYGRTNTGFIKMLYDNILGRIPDDGGLNNWVKDLNNGMPPADVVYYFVFSDELKPKIAMMGPEEFVNFLYKNVFNREPDSDGYNNWVSLMKNGMSKENTLMLFLNCDEFKNICNMFGTTQ